MADVLKQTMTKGSFDDVFTEIKYSGHNELSSNIRLFYLSDIEDNTFDTKALTKLLSRNVGHYLFSRGKIERYRIEDDVESINKDATTVLRDLDATRVFEEIMICFLLEDRLHAPKLMSRPEILNSSGNYDGRSDSIHLLILNDEAKVIQFQMVFGAAKVCDFLDDAIEEAFLKIAAINTAKKQEVGLIDPTLFDNTYDERTSRFLRQLLLPGSSRNRVKENAFGVFIGYKLGLNTAKIGTAQFPSYVESKLQNDVRHNMPAIKERIREAGLEHTKIYFFFIPMNEADDEKESIVKEILR